MSRWLDRCQGVAPCVTQSAKECCQQLNACEAAAELSSKNITVPLCVFECVDDVKERMTWLRGSHDTAVGA
jgi:hypothetical protein